MLRTPSLGERLARARYATEARERVWTSQAAAAQQEVLTTLAIHGVLVRPDFSYQRVLDGFSAALDPRAIALLDQMPEVVGVYPVRSGVSGLGLREAPLDECVRAGQRPSARTQGCRGSTGEASRSRCSTRASTLLIRTCATRCFPGSTSSVATSTPKRAPTRRTRAQLERHGTEMAGIIAGSRGP